MMQKKKTLFLDIDGVLAHFMEQLMTTDRTVSCREIDERKLLLLSRFVKENDLDVVLTSTWRKSEEFRGGHHSFNQFLRTAYGDGVLQVVGYTRVLPGIRGIEIDDYVTTHGIIDYVILDDSSDMLPRQLPRLVHINPLNGLVPTDLVTTATILGLQSEWALWSNHTWSNNAWLEMHRYLSTPHINRQG